LIRCSTHFLEADTPILGLVIANNGGTRMAQSAQKAGVLVFLADSEKAAELALCFDREVHELHLAQNTDDFYHLATSETPEVVIIDNLLPGFLTGIEILERLRKDLLRPACVLIATPDPQLRDRVRTIKAASVVTPELSAQQIALAARSAMTVGNVVHVPVNPRARELVRKADGIRPLPQLVVKYTGQLNECTCSIADLARDIAFDAKATAALLRMANSAAMGLRSKTVSVFDAVKFLGIRKTISLILSSNLAQNQTALAMTLPTAFRDWFHNRTVLIAGAASAFSRRLGDDSSDTAYVLGLLQELGILVLAQAFGYKYPAMVRRVREVGQLRLEIAEQQEFGITHADVSVALLQKWQLSQELIRLVAHHHKPELDAKLPPAEQRSLQLMRMGEAFANLSDNKSPQRHQLFAQMLVTIGVRTQEETKACLAEAITQAVQCAQLLSIPIPDERALRLLTA
jgi:HD-like signal output (HDOD) protein